MITILGAGGFIGSCLKSSLQHSGHEVSSYYRGQELPKRHLGQVLYCIGLTADFRQKPFETVEAHVCNLARILYECSFDTLFYLSSTRLYTNLKQSGHEEDLLNVNPLNPSDIYNISKIMGESLCLHSNRKTCILRLSNVYGPDYKSDNFITAIIREALSSGEIRLRDSPEIMKDYISAESVCNVIQQMLIRSPSLPIYNIASGVNTRTSDILEIIKKMTKCNVVYENPTAPKVAYPQICTTRLTDEFEFNPTRILDDLEAVIANFNIYWNEHENNN